MRWRRWRGSFVCQRTDGGRGGYGWMGGYGGVWLPLLVVIAVAGLVVWVMKQEGK